VRVKFYCDASSRFWGIDSIKIYIFNIMNSFTLNIDSLSSQKVTTVKGDGNPFNMVYTFNSQHTGIKQCALRSVEMPVGFFNVRPPFNTITISGETLAIPPGNYGDVETLIQAISNVSYEHDYGIFDMTINGYVSFVSGGASGFPLTFSTVDNGIPNLLQLIGFQNGSTVYTAGVPIISTFLPRLSFDTYLNIYIPYFGTSSSETYPHTFKLPVNSTSKITYTTGPNWDQIVTSTESTLRLNKLEIQVYDRFGNLLDNNGIDWSLTLEIVSDT